MKCFKIKAKDIDDGDGLKADLTEHNGERVERSFELGLKFNPREEEIVNHGNPDLRKDSVF